MFIVTRRTIWSAGAHTYYPIAMHTGTDFLAHSLLCSEDNLSDGK